MKSLLRLATVAAVAVLFSACKDTDVRQWLHTYYDFNHDRVWPAICTLEVDVYDSTDTGGDSRVATNGGANRLCPPGGGDPPGMPPEPPPI